MSEKYRKFYLDYRDRLFSYLRYRSGDAEVARDIMQDSFTRHFEHYGREAVASPALLFSIARNALVDYQRSRRRLRPLDQAPEPATSDEKVLQAREEAKRVLAAIKRLPEQDGELLLLAVEGMPYKEIATLLTISEAAVKVRIHRARMKIRQFLHEEAL